MNQNKAQMEMMGLVVIVVLVSIGMLFYISFKINTSQQPSTEPQEEYTDKQLATNYLQAALKTTSECKDLNVQQLLQDCALFKNIDCVRGNSCFFVNETLDEINNKTLESWNQGYHFKIWHRDKLLFWSKIYMRT